MEQINNELPLSSQKIRKSAFILSSVVLMLSICFFGWQQGSKKKLNRIVQALVRMEHFTPTSTQSLEELYSVMSLLKKDPEVKERLSDFMMRALLLNGKPLEAEEFYSKAALNYENFYPAMIEFSRISFLIEQKLYAEAIESSLNLKNTMVSNHNFWNERRLSTHVGSILYLQNLLRTSILYHELKEFRREKEILAELKKALNDAGSAKNFITAEAVKQFYKQYHFDHADLNEYLD